MDVKIGRKAMILASSEKITGQQVPINGRDWVLGAWHEGKSDFSNTYISHYMFSEG